MTCIVAAVAKGGAWIGGDSAGVGGLSLAQRADPKVFKKGELLFGFTSSFRMGQLLRYRFEPPRYHPDCDLLEYMSTDFIDGVRVCLKDYGFARTRNGEEEGGTFLAVFRGTIFKIHDDFQVGQSLFPYDACGCGEDIALDALYAMHNDGSVKTPPHPNLMVKRALEAAQAFSAGVRAPFNIINFGAAM